MTSPAPLNSTVNLYDGMWSEVEFIQDNFGQKWKMQFEHCKFGCSNFEKNHIYRRKCGLAERGDANNDLKREVTEEGLHTGGLQANVILKNEIYMKAEVQEAQ